MTAGPEAKDGRMGAAAWYLDSMGPARFELTTSCSGGKRSIQLSYGPVVSCCLQPSIGAPGFEPGTSCSRSRRANRAALRPVPTDREAGGEQSIIAEGKPGRQQSDRSQPNRAFRR